jgi:hypothetical protein
MCKVLIYKKKSATAWGPLEIGGPGPVGPLNKMTLVGSPKEFLNAHRCANIGEQPSRSYSSLLFPPLSYFFSLHFLPFHPVPLPSFFIFLSANVSLSSLIPFQTGSGVYIFFKLLNV